MSATDSNQVQQYLTFKLGDEVFAIDVAKVREVLDMATITAIPRTPAFMRGVINLRGNVVPVVDLRLCLEMPRTERTRTTCIVVVEVLWDGEVTVIGAMADSVQEVIDLEASQIRPAPKLGAHTRIEFIKGLANRESGVTMILDIDRVFSSGDMAAIRTTEAVQPSAGASA